MQKVARGSDRFFVEDVPTPFENMPTDMADLNAVANAEPVGIEHRKVMDSFDIGRGNTRDAIEAKAEDRILFTNGQRIERKLDQEKAIDEIAADKQAVKDEEAADAAAIAETERIRKERIDHAQSQVAQAKERAMELKIKADQAEAAAALGRKIGAVQGSKASKEAWGHYHKVLASEKKASALKAAQAKVAAREAAVRAAVESKTAAQKKAEQAQIAAADKAAEMAIAKAAAESATKRTDIGGPEGLKNRMTEEKAEFALQHYKREAEAAQKRIRAAAMGNYPDGDWPVGPGDAPDADVEAEVAAIDAAAWGINPFP
jgi:hypothetical protein